MVADPVKIGVLALLFAAFLFVPRLSAALGHSLDTLPVRLAAVIIILASVSYDKYVSLGLFLVITATYIKHHQHDLMSLATTGDIEVKANPYEIPRAPVNVVMRMRQMRSQISLLRRRIRMMNSPGWANLLIISMS